MSTAGGPRLEGIGRSGDSDIVLCMDAHDAGSYPGEPTTNDCTFTFSDSATDGSGQGSVGIRTLITNNHVRIVDVASNTRQTFLIEGLTASTTYTISTLYKKLEGTPTFRYQIQDHSGSTFLRLIKFTNTAEIGIEDKDGWQLASWTFVLGSDANAARIWFQDGADYTTYTHSFELKNPQLEAKAYATPFVREGNGGTGTYNARPASVDLMIHGNVGTGTTFEDSSPKKLALTNTNGVSHAGTSEFGGSALKFVRSSTQYITTSSTSDINFGTGDWTIDYWFNMTSGQTDRMHALNVGTGSVANISFNFNDGHAFWLYWNGTGTPNIIFGSDGDYGDGAWHHMAVTRASGMVRVWVDGVHKGSSNYSSSSSMGQTASLYVGAGSLGVLTWDGYLDEVRVCKGTALWVGSGNFTPPTRRNLSAPVVDLSGSDNGGNFATKDMTDVVTYRDGQVIEPVASAVWDFDGTDDVIDLGNINYNGLTGLTVATWVYSSNFAANDSFLSSWGDNSNSNYAWLLFASQWVSTKIDWLISTNGTSYTRCAGTLGLTNNLWYHIVGTWNSSGAMVLYINGALDGTATGPASIMNNDFNTFIGCDSDGGGGAETKTRFFGGQMGNATIWKTTLTAAQVKQNFNSQRSRFKV
jgi:hypothetical protein